MLRAVALGLGLVVVVLGVTVALAGPPLSAEADPAAWLAVVGGVLFMAGIFTQWWFLSWLGNVAVLLEPILGPFAHLPVFVPMALLMALALWILSTKPAYLHGAPESR